MIYLSDDYRVRPLDHLQWVMERRDGHKEPSGTVRENWRPFAYCRTRIGLETALSRLRADYGINLDPELIVQLPDRFL